EFYADVFFRESFSEVRNEAVGYSAVRIVEPNNEAGKLCKNMFLPLLAKGLFCHSRGVVQQADVSFAEVAVQYRGEGVDRKVNDLVTRKYPLPDSLLCLAPVGCIVLPNHFLFFLPAQLLADL